MTANLQSAGINGGIAIVRIASAGQRQCSQPLLNQPTILPPGHRRIADQVGSDRVIVAIGIDDGSVVLDVGGCQTLDETGVGPGGLQRAAVEVEGAGAVGAGAILAKDHVRYQGPAAKLV